MIIVNDRLKGTKEILPVFDTLYGITTWPGVICFCKRNDLMIHSLNIKNGRRKPMVMLADIVEHELRHGRSVTIDSLKIS
jgi:hypothetical protein